MRELHLALLARILFHDGTQLLHCQQILFTSQRFLCPDQISHSNDTALASKQLNPNRCFTDTVEVTYTGDRTQYIDWTPFGLQVEIFRRDARIRVVQKRKSLRSKAMSRVQLTKRLAQFGYVRLGQYRAYVQIAGEQG